LLTPWSDKGKRKSEFKENIKKVNCRRKENIENENQMTQTNPLLVNIALQN